MIINCKNTLQLGHPTNSWRFPSPTDINTTPIGSLGTDSEKFRGSSQSIVPLLRVIYHLWRNLVWSWLLCSTAFIFSIHVSYFFSANDSAFLSVVILSFSLEYISVVFAFWPHFFGKFVNLEIGQERKIDKKRSTLAMILF